MAALLWDRLIVESTGTFTYLVQPDIRISEWGSVRLSLDIRGSSVLACKPPYIHNMTSVNPYIIIWASWRPSFLYPKRYEAQHASDPQQSREPTKQLQQELDNLRPLLGRGDDIRAISEQKLLGLGFRQALNKEEEA